MRSKLNISVVFMLVVLTLTSFAPVNDSGMSPLQVDGGLAVVANPKGAPAEMALNKLKSVLKGEQQRWKDGTKVCLAFMKTATPVGDDMTKRIFGMTAKELNKFILAQVFQGKMSSPQFFDTEEDLLKYVKNKEGAIGVVSFKGTSGAPVITIDGKKSI